jgi:hypothetical protein
MLEVMRPRVGGVDEWWCRRTRDVKERWAKYLAMVRLYACVWHVHMLAKQLLFCVPPLHDL